MDVFVYTLVRGDGGPGEDEVLAVIHIHVMGDRCLKVTILPSWAGSWPRNAPFHPGWLVQSLRGASS